MDCDKFRENYKKCFMEFGSRQCRADLDELYKCLYDNEFYIKNKFYSNHKISFSRPMFQQ